MLNLKEIRKEYITSSETVHALRGVSLAFRKSEFVSILGPSGCGKTTLLNIIGGLDHYTTGDLVINGRSTTSFTDRDWDVYRNHRIGFIFQSYNLIPHQTILGNVELALTIAGISREERTERAKRVLDRVGLSGQYYKRPNQLSGGQCQRVAIARALVNDPEILLADEPTGALDTQTSVQIMELIREISGERLVIMVTHNPELAERYSTRIVRLLDGEVTEDTNPYSPEDEEAECRAEREEEERAERAARADIEAIADKKARKKAERTQKRRKEKAKMSFFAAFRLSARNLISKKGRTSMVGIAGSIGIIGVALVLAFSAGIKGYIVSMQDDMLSGNPILISETAIDLEALQKMMSTDEKVQITDKRNGYVYVNSIVEYLAKMNSNVASMIINNEITEDYMKYVLSMPKEYYAAMILDYGIDLTNNIYTEFATEGGGKQKLSISAITSIYSSILEKTEFKNYAGYIPTLAPSFRQAPNNADYIASQYEVYGRIATGKNEIMLVLNKNDELADVLLARLGYYTQDEFMEIVHNTGRNEGRYDFKYEFSNEELLSKKFTWYPNDTVFRKNNGLLTSKTQPYFYTAGSDGFAAEDGLELEVVGILTPREDVSFGCMESGIYYTAALSDFVLQSNRSSEIVNELRENGKDSYVSMKVNDVSVGISYTYTYTYEGTEYTDTAFCGTVADMSDMLSSFVGGGAGMGGAGGAGGMDVSSVKYLTMKGLGGNTVASKISVFPISFDDKDLVTGYLDRWNNDESLTIDGKEIEKAERSRVTYTDSLSLVINIINTMINVVSYALIAFTSISLVVSTVMIGIITYVSVVERIKEIGVIRALGGRKRDVRHLFNAETFIIGLLAGVFGVAVTYILCGVANAILYPLTGVPQIAMLPVPQALLMIAISVALTLISGLIPASSAAKKDPVVALRTE